MIVVLVIAAVGATVLLREPGEAAAGGGETTAPRTPQKTRAVAKPRTPQSSSAVRARPSDKARMKLHGVITGNISPKSVASSGSGYVTAQNMMYRHSVTVYDARSLKLVKTISDAVDLRRLGYPSYPGTSRGAPVEAAFSSDGRYAYVSNCSMYGARFGPEGDDDCTPSSGYGDSFVWATGSAPRSLALAADGRALYVVNYESGTITKLRTSDMKTLQTIEACYHPIGITYDSRPGAYGSPATPARSASTTTTSWPYHVGARALLAVVSIALVVPAVAIAKSQVYFEDTIPSGGASSVTFTTHKAASFRVRLRVPTAGRAKLSLLGKKAPKGINPLIATSSTSGQTGQCQGTAGSFYCTASYEPLPKGTYTGASRGSASSRTARGCPRTSS